MANQDINNVTGRFLPDSIGQQAASSSEYTYRVQENETGAHIKEFGVADPDFDQEHIFSVDDDRFEFVDNLLKLKDEYSLDYEEAASVPLIITVTDSGGLTSQSNIRVEVLNAGEPIDSGLTNITPSTAPVPEDTVIGGAVGLQVKAVDPDGDAVRYEMIDSAGGLFAVDEVTGVVTVAAPLDYETASSYVVVIRAISEDGSSVDNEFLIEIGDVDEVISVSPVGDSNTDDNAVEENAAIGTGVGITASAGAGPDDSVTYALTDDAGGRFAINSQTGEITVAGELDYETASSHTIRVQATASNGTVSEDVFTVTVNDVDEIVPVSPVIDVDISENAVSENTAVGTAVGVIAAASAGPGETVTFSLVDDSEGRFAINPETGEVTVAGELDYETASSHTVRVQATASNGTVSETSFMIAVNDVNETVPVSLVVDNDTAENTVDENSAVGAGVGIVASATAGPDDSITYALIDDAGGRFAINPQTGEVTVAGELDYETASSHTVRVQATASNGTVSEESFTIAVGNTNEAPTLTVNGLSGTETETFENGATGWSDNTVTDGGAGFSHLLGRFGVGGAVEKTFAIDPDADQAVIEFDLYELDSWDNENFIIEIAGEQVEIPLYLYRDDENRAGTSGNVSWSLESQGPGASLGGSSWATDQIHKVRLEITNPDNNVTLKLSSTLDEVVDNESWGIDNLSVQGFGASGNPLTLAITEGVAGATVATLTVQDPDGSGVVTYAVDDDRFEVVDGTLKLKADQSLDYETESSVTLTVRVTDASGLTDQQTLTIGIIDVDETVPVSSVTDVESVDNSVDENSAVGAGVGITASAKAGPDDTVTYSLVNDADGRFTINPQTGEVTVAGELDYETASSHTITVQAAASNGTVSEESFTIAVSDTNEAPTLTVTGHSGSVTETFENGAAGWSDNTVTDGGAGFSNFLGRFGAGGAVEKTFAVDPDADKAVVEFDLYEIDSWDSELLRIDVAGQRIDLSFNWKENNESVAGATGNVTWSVVTQGAGAALGGTQGAYWSDSDQIHRVRLEIDQPESDITLRLSDTLNQEIADESWGIDNLSVQGLDASGEPLTLAITEGIAGAKVATLEVQDPDGSGDMTYAVDDDRFEVVDGTLKLKADQTLDYETESSVTLTVTVTDASGLTDQQTLTVSVIDVDETVPVSTVTDVESVDNSVDEHSAVGTGVGITASATAGPDDTVSYSLVDDADGRFAINPQTGEVTVAGDLDYETASSHTITVQATASNGTVSEENFTIAVSDTNEAPTLTVTGNSGSVTETFENGATGWSDNTVTDGGAGFSNFLGRFGAGGAVEKTFAVDPDAEKAVIEFDLYEIDSWDSELFKIDVAGQRIELTFNWKESNESAAGATGNVTWSVVTQGEGTALGGTEGISWSDSDQIHRVRLEIDQPGSSITLGLSDTLDQEIADESWGIDNLSVQGLDASGKPLTLAITEGIAGVTVATLEVKDPDGVGAVTYAVDDDRFEVVEGILKLKADQALDYETESAVTLTVTVTDASGLTDQQTLKIGVIDVYETVHVSEIEDTDTTVNSVDENSATGTSVGITAAAFAGVDDTVSYNLFGDADGRFAINSQTGEITVAGELDHESGSRYTVGVQAIASNGTTREKEFSITVNDLNEAPVLTVVGQSGSSVTENFNNGATGWSHNTITDGGEHFGTFLGRFGNQSFFAGPDVVEKTFALASGTEAAVIEFDLYEIDSWDNESFIIEVAGEQIQIPLSVRSDEHASSGIQGDVSWTFTPQGPSDNLGFTSAWYVEGTDQIHKIRLEVQNPGDVLTLKLTSTLDEAIDNESWGIDNFSLTSLDSTGGPLTQSVQEGVAGATVATLAVQDPDGAGAVTYAVDDDRFEVVDGTLKLKADQSLDYETESSVTVTVTVTDAGGLTDQQTLTIGVADVDETVPVSPVNDTDAFDNSVNENSAAGTGVGITASAKAGPDDTVSYSLVDDADGRFAINPQTGEVTVAGELDYETASSHTIKVQATASNGTVSEESFTIAVSDTNEAPTLVVSGQGGSVTETFENGATGWSDNTVTDGGTGFSRFLGRFGAGGAVEKTFTVDPGADKAVVEFDLYEIDSWDNELFHIEVDGQQIDVSLSWLRQEESASGVSGNVSWSLLTQGAGAALGGSHGYFWSDDDQIHKVRLEIDQPGTDVTLRLSDSLNPGISEGIDDESWGIDNLSVQGLDAAGNPLTLAIQEGVTGAAIATLAVQDPDAADTATYSVDDGRFEIVDGILKLKADQSLDYETETAVTVTVTVTDAGGKTDQQTLIIGVIDVVEVTPVSTVVDVDTADNAVDENSVAGTTVGIIANASAGPDDSISYALADDAEGRFAIDAQTGEITVAGPLNYEANNSHTVRVQATASNGTVEEQEFDIAVRDVNEPPVILFGDQALASDFAGVLSDGSVPVAGDIGASDNTANLQPWSGEGAADNSIAGIPDVADLLDDGESHDLDALFEKTDDSAREQTETGSRQGNIQEAVQQLDTSVQSPPLETFSDQDSWF